MDVTSAPDFDVAIIGYGPVGAALALALAQQGVRVAVLEKEREIYDLPRAVHFDDEAMRLFQALGVAEALLPLVHVSPGMKFIKHDGHVLLDWSRPQTLTALGWNLSYRFHQPDLERVLRAALAGHGDNAPSQFAPSQSAPSRLAPSLFLGAEVFAIRQDETGVELSWRAEGTERRLSAAYVVGCDGGRSFVRGEIGGAQEDLGFRERWLVIDLLLKRPRPDLGRFSLQFCDPERPATYVCGIGARRRWEIALKPEESAQDMVAHAAIWPLLQRWIGPDDAAIERAACYTFHSVIAGRWRDRRLLIAGDAAHQTPPFLGQGLCAGLRDVANLAWKLALVVKGEAEDALLNSYESERRPHVRDYIALAVRMGALINASAQEAIAKDSAGREETGAAILQRARDEDGAAAIMITQKPKLGAGLSLGAGAYERAGEMAPQPRVASGRMDEFIGWRFALLARPETLAQLSSEDRARLERAGARALAVEAEELLDFMGPAIALIIRPDRYVCAAPRDAAELSRALDDLARLITPHSHPRKEYA